MSGSAMYLASAAAGEQPNLLGSLGIDWTLLVLQTIAFLLLLVILSKFVFPVLSRMLEKREQLIEDSIQAAADAEKHAVEAEAKLDRMLKDARKQADETIASAKQEAAQLLSDADAKSRARAEQVVADTEAEIRKEVAAARSMLREEALSLVSEATEKVLKKAVTRPVDARIVSEAIAEVDRS